jgi:hypothetical protein
MCYVVPLYQGRAWFDEPTSGDVAHGYFPCSNMGKCDRTTGTLRLKMFLLAMLRGFFSAALGICAACLPGLCVVTTPHKPYVQSHNLTQNCFLRCF